MILAAIVIGILALIWFWKVPLTRMVNALKEGGSSTFEAYFVVILLLVGSIAAIYMMWQII
jgi:hypothetical protein